MRYDPIKHHRRSIRLRGYDYSEAGEYYVTLCVHGRSHAFGDIKNGMMLLSDIGEIASSCWLEIPRHFSNVVLDEFVIMPDHMHGILILRECVPVGVQYIEPRQDQTTHLNQYQRIIPGSLSSIVRCYKAAVTRNCHRQGILGFQWQRNFYEHIIRDGNDHARIQKYIADNVNKWSEGEEHLRRGSW
jgi:putative transposase